MPNPLSIFADVRDFLEAGGPVVQVLIVVGFLLWVLIFERIAYYQLELPKRVKETEARWDVRKDHTSWFSRQIKSKLVSEARADFTGTLPLIKAVVALCPLLGLLGTVTGMIQVFDVMAALGTGNARAMASGVSAATLPTMVGIALALTGLYPIARFEQVVSRESRRLSDHMTTT